MREKINKLAQGNIDNSTPLIFVEPTSIEYELTPDQSVKLEIMITSANGIHIKGLAYSSDTRIRILNPSFGGNTVRLVFEAMLKATDSEDCITGDIDLVTNGGEFSVPFRFHKKETEEEEELYCLSSLEDFAAMAEEDKASALRVFSLTNFLKAPFMRNIRFRTIYNEFRKCPDREIAMEQFIAACGIRINNYSKESINFSNYKNDNSVHADDFKVIKLDCPDKFKRHYYEYARLKLAYDMDSADRSEVLEQMTVHLDAMIGSGLRSEYIVLLKAETEFLKGNIREALILMNSVSLVIRENRQEKIHEYFMLEYLEIIINHRDRASFIRLCKKFIEEQHFNELFIYVIRLDDELLSNDIQFRNFLTDVFSYGVRSPWLYYYYCLLLNEHPEYLYAPKSIDRHSLNFGRKYHIVNDNITKAVVAASCTAYIKSDKRMISAHRTYAEGIELDLSINGLYEYYLFTLPNDPEFVIHDKVFEHYRSGDSLEVVTKTRLYANLVKNKKKTTALYKAYEDRIIDFALSQLREQNINPYLQEIYVSVIRPDMIGAELSEQFMKLVNCFSIKTENPHVRSVIITHAQSASESVFPTTAGNAVVPVYYPNEIILFQDTYGNRFYDVPYTKQQLFPQNSYRNAADKMSGSSTVVRIRRTNELMLKKSLNGDDILHLENEVYCKEINEDSKALIISKLIQYYNQHAASGYNPDFLLKINKVNLSASERQDLCNAYIICGCYTQAYEMIKEFGFNGIADKNLKTLCINLVQQSQFRTDDMLLTLCEYAVCRNLQDSSILEYLCRYYNGPTDIMYDVLRKSISAHNDTHDMEERLIAQLIFIGNTQLIDQVFEWYVSRRKASESIVKAYFTIKSSEYFLNNAVIEDRIFEYIENVIQDISDCSSIPLIYILALTRYYSESQKLNQVRIDTARRLSFFLISRKYTFNYLKKFDKYFRLPGDFMSRQIITYRANPGKSISFRSRIVPSESTFVHESADCSFMNLFLKTKVLFSGETWEYEIYENDGGENRKIDSGSVQLNNTDSEKREFKYHELNAICCAFESGNDIRTIGMMREYAAKEAGVRNLFK